MAVYELLDSTTLPSNAASVTFSSIDQSYRDLFITVQAKGLANDYTYYRINGLISTIYYYHNFNGNGSSIGGGQAGQQYQVYLSPSREDINNTEWTLWTHEFMDYTKDDKYKTALHRINLADSQTGMSTSLVATTSAITSIEFFGGTNFIAGSYFQLWGVNG